MQATLKKNGAPPNPTFPLPLEDTPTPTHTQSKIDGPADLVVQQDTRGLIAPAVAAHLLFSKVMTHFGGSKGPPRRNV